ncbi:hypothetical protein [Nocardia alni]|uniref:hypothetical protein n=1 Tax=Nocardia alni TaxID=2815723 RepID=UPI001C21AF0D|nr:hypothetical protein [Nocardia alni]
MDHTHTGDQPNIAALPFFSPRPMRDEPGVVEFSELSDRLVRHLFDVGLQLHSLRAVFDRNDSSPREIRAASDGVTDLIDDLDLLIRDAGLTMLLLERDRPAPAYPEPIPLHRRRG